MLKAGTKRANAGHGQQVDGDWIGVLRDGERVVWECCHRHSNRDHYTRRGGPSARQCATQELNRRSDAIRGSV